MSKTSFKNVSTFVLFCSFPLLYRGYKTMLNNFFCTQSFIRADQQSRQIPKIYFTHYIITQTSLSLKFFTYEIVITPKINGILTWNLDWKPNLKIRKIQQSCYTQWCYTSYFGFTIFEALWTFNWITASYKDLREI